MKQISAYISGRDNNFNLLRFIAASTVVFAHSFIVATGDRHAGPLVASTGHDLGYHAVDVFFVASGFLIAQSWQRMPTLPAFLTARFLRLWPALTLCALIIVFFVAPFATSLPLSDYFSSPATYTYIPKVLNIVQVDSSLPGVFTTLRDDLGLDAPLWTLKYEVLCYLCLAAFGLIGGMSSRSRFWRFMVPVMLFLVAASTFPIARDLTHPYTHLIRFGLCFGSGVIAFIAAPRIPLTSLALPATFALAVLLRQTSFYEAALYLFTGYATLWFAFVPTGLIRRFNRLGDYSYGVYIFAYPLQQTLAIRMPGLAPLELFALAYPAALAIAVLSWHFVEKPCLSHKRDLAKFLERFMRGSKDPVSSAPLPLAD